MRELIADLFVTVDGFAAGEGAPAFFGFPGPDLDAWITRELAKPQVIAMGRVTYEVLAPMSSVGTDPGSLRMRQLPKLVFSATLAEPLAWANTRLIRGDAMVAVRELKAHDGDPIRTIGSLCLVGSLLQDGLVDRLRLVVFPQILGGSGFEPAFRGLPDLDLELLGTGVLDGRLVTLEYRPRVPASR